MTHALHFFPVRRQKILQRTRIVTEALRDSPALIILHAGGGAGKSVAAAQIATEFVRTRESAHETASPVSAVWIRHDPDENTEQAFWFRILTSLDQAGLVPEGSTLKDLVRGGLSSATRQTIIAAVAELSGHILLVIDDAHHVLTAPIEESLVHALANTHNLSAIITTHHAPAILSSTSVRLQLPIRIITSDDLALTRDDIGELAQLRLPSHTEEHRNELANQVHSRTQGWPIATDALIIESGSAHTPINTARRGSFIREHVDRLLANASDEARLALCASSQFEEFSAELLARMLELQPTQIDALITTSFEGSLGYWVDESNTRWYRHHELLRTELNSRAEQVIGPAKLQEIYSRSISGLRDTRPRFAKQAAIHAEAWGQLAELLVEDLELVLHRQRPQTWLEKVPADVRAQYPVIAAFALIDEYAFPSGRFRQMIAGLKLLASRSLAKETEQDGLPGITAATLRMVTARLGGLNDLAVKMSDRLRQLLTDLPGEDVAHRGHALELASTQLVVTLLHTGRVSEADSTLEHLLSARCRLRERSVAHATSLSAWARAWQGDLHGARVRLREARLLTVPVGWQSSYLGTGYRLASALSALELAQTVEAGEHLEALHEHEPTIEHWPFLTYVSTLVTESRLGPEEALSALDRQLQRRRGRATTMASTARMLQVLRMRLAWQTGQILAREKRPNNHDAGSVYVALSRSENDVALGLALSTSRLPAFVGNHRGRAELLLLQAESARRLGDTQTATEAASSASRLMAERGLNLPMRAIPRESAEHLVQLVPSLPFSFSSSGSPSQISPLTPAELNAFHMVVHTGSVRAAARELFLSPETVKTYMKQVYRKLRVRTRADAIRVASEARLFAVHSDHSSNTVR